MADQKIVEETFQKIRARFDDPEVKKSLEGFDCVLTFDIKDIGPYTMWIENGECKEFKPEKPENPTAVVIMSSDTLIKVVNKQTNPMKEFTLGRIKTKGSTSILLKLRKLMF